MAQPQQNISLTAPGFYGVNTQDSPLDMDDKFAAEANNCVIDRSGRIASRRGFQYLTTNPAVIGTNPIVSIYEFIRQDTGESFVFAAAANNIYIQQTVAPYELVALTLPVGYPGITADNWQFSTLNNRCYMVQAGHQPLKFDPLVSTTALQDWGQNPQSTKGGTVWPNVVHAAFGRLWVGDFDDDSGIFEWSGLLDGDNWTDQGHGGAQTGLYWPSGYDSIKNISAHNDFLVIFGRRNILLYSTTSDVTSTLNLQDTIEGIGCIARDSVVPTGVDYMFVDSTGVRSLNRTIQEKSVPIGDLSRNVRDEFQNALVFEQEDVIKGVFHVEDSFYCCFLPSNPLTYVFDTWQLLPDGSARATTWTQIKPRCGVRLENRTTLFGGEGGVYYYRGGDDIFLDADNGYQITVNTIPMSFTTHPMDFGAPANVMFPKQVDVTIFNALDGKMTLKWGYDYRRPTNPRSITENFDDQTVATLYYPGTTDPLNLPTLAGQYYDPDNGLAIEGQTGYYTPQDPTATELKYNIWGSGRNIRLGLFADATGQNISIQQIDIQALQGRIL